MKHLNHWLLECEEAWRQHVKKPRVKAAIHLITKDAFELNALKTSWKLNWLQDQANKLMH